MRDKYWHIQMHLPEGKEGSVIDSSLMLKESKPVIGTGEWDDKQCQDFKGIADGMKVGDIVMVRVGNKPLALCEVIGDYFEDLRLTEKYINRLFRYVKVLSWNTTNEHSSLFSQGTLKPLYKSSETRSWNYINNWYKRIIAKMETQNITDILKLKKQIILQGAPGTGKTYATAALALSILDIDYDPTDHTDIMAKYKELINKQIFFTTFHQSMDYEEFIEGIKPIENEGEITYETRSGIFKHICKIAQQKDSMNELQSAIEKFKEKCITSDDDIILETIEKGKFTVSYRGGITFRVRSLKSQAQEGKDFPANIENIERLYKGDENSIYNKSYVWGILNYLQKEYNIPLYKNKENETKNYVLIIDEINRGNISKIFGELITLLEADKRLNASHEITCQLPYSNENFGVPDNLYIIGTMNTTDRSVGHIDYAVRRRFAFYTLKSSTEAIESYYQKIDDSDQLKKIAISLFDSISKFIDDNKLADLDMDDLMVGHSYFMAKSFDELKIKLEYEIIPLIREYEKDGILNLKSEERKNLGNKWRLLLN